MVTNETLIRSIFRDLESQNVERFLRRVTENVWLRLGNSQPAVGKDGVRDHLNELYSKVVRLHFDFTSMWTVPGKEHVVLTELTCIRTDNSRLTIPAAHVLRFQKETDLLEEMQIFADLAPLTRSPRENWYARAASAFDFPEIHPTH